MTTAFEDLHKALENLGFEDVGIGHFRWIEPTQSFRIRVETHRYDYLDGEHHPLAKPQVVLSLPHQCDEWEVAWTKADGESVLEQAQKFREGLEVATQKVGTVERLIEDHPRSNWTV